MEKNQRQAATLADLKREYAIRKLEGWLQKREKDEILWTCKDESKVSIRHMTDSHLANTIMMLERANRREELRREIERIQLDEAGMYCPVWDDES